MLFQIGGFILSIISFITGSGLNRLLIFSLFKTVDPERKKKSRRKQSRRQSFAGERESVPKQQNTNEQILDQIKSRVPFKIRFFDWLCPEEDRKMSKMKQKAEDSIYKELDFIRFVKRQKMYEIAMKVLFSKIELFLIRNQKKPFVIGKSESESDNSSDWEPTTIDMDLRLPFMMRLCSGVYGDGKSPN